MKDAKPLTEHLRHATKQVNHDIDAISVNTDDVTADILRQAYKNASTLVAAGRRYARAVAARYVHELHMAITNGREAVIDLSMLNQFGPQLRITAGGFADGVKYRTTVTAIYPDGTVAEADNGTETSFEDLDDKEADALITLLEITVKDLNEKRLACRFDDEEEACILHFPGQQ